MRDKAIREVVFSLLAFSCEWKFVAVILDINLLSSFLKCRSLTVTVFVFIHPKTLSLAEVYIGYNYAQMHTINSPAWSGLSQS